MSAIPVDALVRSIASESLADVLSNIADTSLDAAIDSGALDGIPIIGTVLGLAKAGKDIRSALYVRKLALFLQGFAEATTECRQQFAQRIREGGESEAVGSCVLLLLERADDLGKPELVGRLMAASAEGRLPLGKALRIAAMLDRAYMQDIIWLRDEFWQGCQTDENRPIAESLMAVGLLSNFGFDGGEVGSGKPSGTVFGHNEYGELFLTHVFGVDLSQFANSPGRRRTSEKGPS